MVDLESYGGVGRCTCKDYQVHFEPILRRSMKPAEAFAMGLLEKDSEGRPKLRWYQADPTHACDCYHMFRAWIALAVAFTKTLMAANAAQRK